MWYWTFRFQKPWSYLIPFIIPNSASQFWKRIILRTRITWYWVGSIIGGKIKFSTRVTTSNLTALRSCLLIKRSRVQIFAFPWDFLLVKIYSKIYAIWIFANFSAPFLCSILYSSLCALLNAGQERPSNCLSFLCALHRNFHHLIPR